MAAIGWRVAVVRGRGTGVVVVHMGVAMRVGSAMVMAARRHRLLQRVRLARAAGDIGQRAPQREHDGQQNQQQQTEGLQHLFSVARGA